MVFKFIARQSLGFPEFFNQMLADNLLVDVLSFWCLLHSKMSFDITTVMNMCCNVIVTQMCSAVRESELLPKDEFISGVHRAVWAVTR